MADTLEHEYKMRFATELQRYDKSQRFEHAAHLVREIIGDETARAFPLYAIQIAEKWPRDPVVVAEIKRLDLIPKTKEELLNDLAVIIADRFAEKGEKIKAIREYGVIMGWTNQAKAKSGADGSVNEFLVKLQGLHNNIDHPVDT